MPKYPGGKILLTLPDTHSSKQRIHSGDIYSTPSRDFYYSESNPTMKFVSRAAKDQFLNSCSLGSTV